MLFFSSSYHVCRLVDLQIGHESNKLLRTVNHDKINCEFLNTDQTTSLGNIELWISLHKRILERMLPMFDD